MRKTKADMRIVYFVLRGEKGEGPWGRVADMRRGKQVHTRAIMQHRKRVDLRNAVEISCCFLFFSTLLSSSRAFSHRPEIDSRSENSFQSTFLSRDFRGANSSSSRSSSDSSNNSNSNSKYVRLNLCFCKYNTFISVSSVSLWFCRELGCLFTEIHKLEWMRTQKLSFLKQ